VTGTAPLRLATDIANQFRHLPGDVAAEKVAAHIRLFWDPRMQAQLHDLVAAAGAECDPTVILAAGLLAAD